MDAVEIQTLYKFTDADDKAECFYGLLNQELVAIESFLGGEEQEVFSRYYRKFSSSNRKRLNHTQKAVGRRVVPLINSIVASNTKILDAGCGFGSESILCGILGARVTGIDLQEVKISAANKRLAFYSDILGKPLEVAFYLESVFDISDTFDVIHAMEAISHIEPADRFIEFAYEHLEPGGRLIISDSNALNPYLRYFSLKAQRRRGKHIDKINPRTGKSVSIANERLFTVSSMKRMLILKGFDIEDILFYGFCPYIPIMIKSEDLGYHIGNLCSRLPVVNMFGTCYTITARKRSMGESLSGQPAAV